jgi:hypothetical protein
MSDTSATDRVDTRTHQNSVLATDNGSEEATIVKDGSHGLKNLITAINGTFVDYV